MFLGGSLAKIAIPIDAYPIFSIRQPSGASVGFRPVPPHIHVWVFRHTSRRMWKGGRCPKFLGGIIAKLAIFNSACPIFSFRQCEALLRPGGHSFADARGNACVGQFQASPSPGDPFFPDARREACVAQFQALSRHGGPSFPTRGKKTASPKSRPFCAQAAPAVLGETCKRLRRCGC